MIRRCLVFCFWTVFAWVEHVHFPIHRTCLMKTSHLSKPQIPSYNNIVFKVMIYIACLYNMECVLLLLELVT